MKDNAENEQIHYNGAMYLIVGLGNPTKKYEHTRHNVGFDCLDILAARLTVKISRSMSRAHIGKGIIGKEKVVLAKPQTFMNLSGQAVQSLMRFYRIDPARLIVIYDDSDLDAGRLRIRKSGSAGGHNGMKDIIAMTGTQDFTRIRVGIGKCPPMMDMADFVLGHPEGEDRALLEEAMERAAQAAEDIVINGADHAMNCFNS